jgi:hypothetical protein
MMTAEEQRLEEARKRTNHWKRWVRISAEAEYPGWLSRLLTHPVGSLENYQESFERLTNPNGAIKVFCEVAEL